MRVSDFDFDLPESLIALNPAAERDLSRLLEIAPGSQAPAFRDRRFRDLPTLLRSGDLLVLNDTKVIRARLAGVRPARDQAGADVAVDVTLHKRRTESGGGEIWDAFARPAKRLAVGDVIRFDDGLSARVLFRDGPEARLEFNLSGATFDAALARIGAPPLPPYIARRRPVEASDHARYLTVNAASEGSVAAPTAGLHFTEDLFAALDAAGVGRVTVTLHVGAGTFLPVEVEDTKDHKMHAERGAVTDEQAEAINETRMRGGRIIAVGTTSLRLIESAVREDGRVAPFDGETDIFITPGFRFRCADALITNFHLPRSTLFMLVCAFAGTERMKAAYAHAINSGYRFYSYGDACLLTRGPA